MLWVKIMQIDDITTNDGLTIIGGIKKIASRSSFYISVPNMLMIGVIFYNDSTIVQGIFPTVYYWLGFILFVFVPAVLLFDYSIMYPLEVKFANNQSEHTKRSPMYRDIQEIKRDIEEIKRK